MVDEEWMTVAEVAQHLKVGPETVRRWLRGQKGRRLRGILISDRGGYRVARNEVDRFIREDLRQPDGAGA